MSADNLTEYEVEGLKIAYTFADGHAYHEMPPLLRPVINKLDLIWKESETRSTPETEERFKKAVARIINSPILSAHSHYSLCPTSSNSIDICGAWLRSKNYKTGLLEPVFDNLYLLLRRRGVDVFNVGESDLLDFSELGRKIDEHGLKAVFIVSPNNPTGFQLDAEQFESLAVLCEAKKVFMIIDTSFRLYSRKPYDEYAILSKVGTDYVVIEDTGKTWPTHDTKVSLMA